MAQIPSVPAVVLAAVFFVLPAAAQPAAAAGSDLAARLKDIEGNPRLLESAARAGGKLASFCACWNPCGSTWTRACPTRTSSHWSRT